MTIVEDPHGAPLYRRVVVGFLPRGPTGKSLCVICCTNEVYTKTSRYCGSKCRLQNQRDTRPPKARFLPCPVCGRPCIKCLRLGDCRLAWRWKGRTPLFKAPNDY